jgi:hypothetical protein
MAAKRRRRSSTVQVVEWERQHASVTSPREMAERGVYTLSSRCHYGGISPAVALTDSSNLLLLGTLPRPPSQPTGGTSRRAAASLPPPQVRSSG